MTSTPTPAASALPFPLVRHLSRPMTALLLRLPISANQVTTLSLLLGLGCAGLLAIGEPLAAALLLIACYVLDNCDGEVARARGQCSNFGMHFDTFVDWLVHAAFFAGLAIGVARESGASVWLWLGAAAAAGATVNYLLGLGLAARDRRTGASPQGSRPVVEDAGDLDRPHGVGEWLLFAFRELTRADFCFIVLLLALVEASWLLLPAGAAGSQVYWMSQFFRRAREFHV